MFLTELGDLQDLPTSIRNVGGPYENGSVRRVPRKPPLYEGVSAPRALCAGDSPIPQFRLRAAVAVPDPIQPSIKRPSVFENTEEVVVLFSDTMPVIWVGGWSMEGGTGSIEPPGPHPPAPHPKKNGPFGMSPKLQRDRPPDPEVFRTPQFELTSSDRAAWGSRDGITCPVLSAKTI